MRVTEVLDIIMEGLKRARCACDKRGGGAHVRQATQANCGCARTNCSDNFFNKTNKYTISNAAIHNYIYMTLLI